MNNKYIRLVKLPCRVKGMTVADADGNYNVYLNKNLTREAQVEALLHETEHIERDDLHSYKSVSFLEGRIKGKSGVQ